MRRPVLALLSSVAVLLSAAPAFACNGDCDCPHKHEQAAAPKSDDAKAQKKDAAAPDSVLAPVDEVLSATCSCGGPGDCTCKKGECKCKKCSHHQMQDGVKKTQLLEPLNGTKLTPVLPESARLDATAGTMI